MFFRYKNRSCKDAKIGQNSNKLFNASSNLQQKTSFFFCLIFKEKFNLIEIERERKKKRKTPSFCCLLPKFTLLLTSKT